MIESLERGTQRRWRTHHPVEWAVGNKGGYKITIPAGTDFESSVTWWGRWFVGQDDPRFLLAALVHDYLLEAGTYGRVQAAAEWYDGARAANAPAFRAKVGFIAVAFWAVFRPE